MEDDAVLADLEFCERELLLCEFMITIQKKELFPFHPPETEKQRLERE